MPCKVLINPSIIKHRCKTYHSQVQLRNPTTVEYSTLQTSEVTQVSDKGCCAGEGGVVPLFQGSGLRGKDLGFTGGALRIRFEDGKDPLSQPQGL